MDYLITQCIIKKKSPFTCCRNTILYEVFFFMETFKVGDIVARKSYNFDIMFRVVNIRNEIVDLVRNYCKNCG